MILLGLGANLPSTYGSPEDTLKSAVIALKERNITICSASHIWISAPIPASDQPDYRNATLHVKTSLDSRALLKTLHAIEEEFGRQRDVRNEPRILDLDILAYHNEIIEESNVTIPHPRLHERAFVLYPLQEIAPEWTHPKTGRSIHEMIQSLGKEQIITKTHDTLLA